jgi:phosphatidylserine/phosphatidylglycerophosphate/cardiolipin synthase-like enzyme
VTSGGVTVQAIAGTRAVFLGLDLDPAVRDGCLGFGIHRQGAQDGSDPHWLSGFKTFKSVVPQPDPKENYPSDSQPVQSFYWGDYTATPGRSYAYRVVPLYGSPADPAAKPGVEATVVVDTDDPADGVHGIYFNRGVAASQAYSVRFGDRPDKLPAAKREAAMRWLSRGLDEALVAFIDQASSPAWALRASAFELTEPGVLAAFQRAHDNGASVKLTYHAKDDDTGNANRTALAEHPLSDGILIERSHGALSHNKTIVLCRAGAAGALEPVSVWSGSTNWSQGGLFGHSNVGHVVRDAAVAARYLEYWTAVSGDPDVAALRDVVSAQSPFSAADPPDGGITVLFSPRHGMAPLDWYAQRFGGAASSAHITLAFGMTKVLEDALLAATGDAVRFVMLNKADDHQDTWSADRDHVVVAVGARADPDALQRWADETLTGFNSFVEFLHTKILLVDPLSAHPTVISGSANFSPDSTNSNDENMLVIDGDLQVADTYFTEFARVFQHFYSRYWAMKMKGQAAEDSDFLTEDAAWQKPYTAGSKRRRRVMFSREVDGNAP